MAEIVKKDEEALREVAINEISNDIAAALTEEVAEIVKKDEEISYGTTEGADSQEDSEEHYSDEEFDFDDEEA